MSGHGSYRVTDPASGKVLESFNSSTDSEIKEALHAARTAYEQWSRTPLRSRTAILKRAAVLFRERAAELAPTVMAEMGKPVSAALGELSVVADIFDFYADHAEELLADVTFEPASGGVAVVQQRPIGAILGIMPWNYPHYQTARLVAPNLALGNAVIIKPASSCPRSALEFGRILSDAGVPDGVLGIVFADSAQIAEMIADPVVAGVSLTGSERAGAAVAEVAGRHLKKVVLELGGSDPLIVVDAPDIRELARTAYRGRLANMGQACNSPKRMIVVDEFYDEFVDEIVSLARQDGLETRTLAPLASAAAAEEIAQQIREAADSGATLHVGGDHSNGTAFVTPAVITDVTPSMSMYHEEVFGPVLVIYRVPDIRSAIELANDTRFGLGAAIFMTNEDAAMELAEHLDCGMVYINTLEDSEADLPFGGVKMSGFGRELGAGGIQEFANAKLLRIAAR